MLLAGITPVLPAEAQQLTSPLKGPDTPEVAGYGYLSFVESAKDQFHQMHYELCNRRTSNLAFRWLEPGFEMLADAPLPPPKCAIFERSAGGYRREPKTQLVFSDKSSPAEAYIPCNARTAGGCEAMKGPKWQFGELNTFMSGPTGVVSPLRILVKSTAEGGFKKISVNWTSAGMKFLLTFPKAKSPPQSIRRSFSNVETFYSYGRFPRLSGSPFLAGNDQAELLQVGQAAFAWEGKSQSSGEWNAAVSSDIDLGDRAVVVVVDSDFRVTAIMSSPLAETPQ